MCIGSSPPRPEPLPKPPQPPPTERDRPEAPVLSDRREVQDRPRGRKLLRGDANLPGAGGSGNSGGGGLNLPNGSN